MMNPELMVIGDSLAQGVQSMTFKPEFAGQCVGARLAAIQGWSFNQQNHPRQVLIDAEAEIRGINTWKLAFSPLIFHELLAGLCDRINANLELWMQDLVDNTTPKEVPPFDNLGVGGAVIGDLSKPAATWRQFLKDNRHYKCDSTSLDATFILKLFKAINYAYILNPGRIPGFENFSVLDWVQYRKPKRLHVSIGHNDGPGNQALWNVGFSAANNAISIDLLQGPDQSLTKLGQFLVSLNCQWVCWDLLPKISAVANLEPVGSDWKGSGPGAPDNYCDLYRPVLGWNGSHLTGDQLKAIDASIVQTNKELRAFLTGLFLGANKAGHLRFFDDYAFFQDLDFKNQKDYSAGANQAIRVGFALPKWEQYVDNRYLFAIYLPIPGAPPHGKIIPEAKQLGNGGLQSLDGMHPTSVGYQLKAIAMANQIDLGLRPVPSSDALLGKAFAESPLLSDFPTVVNTLRLILRGVENVAALTSAGGAPTTKTPPLDPAAVASAKNWARLLCCTSCQV